MEEWVKLATDLVAPYEGCHTVKRDGLVYPYLDKLAKPPVWTQGYGITYGVDENSEAQTQARARELFEQGIRNYGMKVAALAPGLLLKPVCHAAVTSWAWNCGINAFKASRLRRAINEGRWYDAAMFILKPDTAGGVVYRGLTKRRSAEAALFTMGI